ncbi:hypothetical protein Syun_004051 [Stephania yunnanensis]|uniref:Uncharacterized protein n=1 Tax=Stephania yunnanensis TaxID=152371 RepID=A0AAP0Q265_9MAGN
MANKHTIILMQTSQNRSSRTFMDFGSISQAMDVLITLFRAISHTTESGLSIAPSITSRN